MEKKIEIGDRVRILTGCYLGFYGEVLLHDNKGHYKVKLELNDKITIYHEGEIEKDEW